MPRRHGWQLPFHSFQLAAITVFFVLSIVFYAFFAPFLGKDLYGYVADGVYGLLAFLIIVLYVRSAAIDPADPGIMINNGGEGVVLEEPNKLGMSTFEKSGSYFRNDSVVSFFCCALFVKEDCRNDDTATNGNDKTDEALFCTLCNTEVRKNSKHCRSCDKCVDGFDHHCRWLNNCVGRKNYFTFLCLMAGSVAWLALESGVGIAVFIRYFVYRRATGVQISHKLGDGFPQPLFPVIVAFCTVLSLLASVPLGELFCFHMILLKKGLTTYEYVVAMRTQNELPGLTVNEDHQSLASSPISSAATAISGSSLGLQYRGAFCTPPRIFVDQDEIMPHLEHGRVPSTLDPDDPAESEKKQPRQQVRISAWNLAKLDTDEAKGAAAKARASSSVLKPIGSRMQHDKDRMSSGNVSGRSSVISADTRFQSADTRFQREPSYSMKSSYPPSHASKDCLESYSHTPSSLGSPHQAAAPSLGQPLDTQQINPIYQTSINPSPLSVKTNAGNPSAAGGTIRPDAGNQSAAGPDAVRRKNESSAKNATSVYWDQEAGRFVSSQNPAGSSSISARTELLYTGKSIFFGGPLLADDMARSSKSSYRGRGHQQLPVFMPTEPGRDKFSRLHQ